MAFGYACDDWKLTSWKYLTELAPHKWLHRPRSQARGEGRMGRSFRREIPLLRRGDGMGNDRTEKKGRRQARGSHYALCYDYYLWTGYRTVATARQWHSFEVLKPSTEGHFRCLKKSEAGSPLPFLHLIVKTFTKKLHGRAEKGAHWGVSKALSLVSESMFTTVGEELGGLGFQIPSSQSLIWRNRTGQCPDQSGLPEQLEKLKLMPDATKSNHRQLEELGEGTEGEVERESKELIPRTWLSAAPRSWKKTLV